MAMRVIPAVFRNGRSWPRQPRVLIRTQLRKNEREPKGPQQQQRVLQDALRGSRMHGAGVHGAKVYGHPARRANPKATAAVPDRRFIRPPQYSLLTP
jgi:hypothetical protein